MRTKSGLLAIKEQWHISLQPDRSSVPMRCGVASQDSQAPSTDFLQHPTACPAHGLVPRSRTKLLLAAINPTKNTFENCRNSSTEPLSLNPLAPHTSEPLNGSR